MSADMGGGLYQVAWNLETIVLNCLPLCRHFLRHVFKCCLKINPGRDHQKNRGSSKLTASKLRFFAVITLSIKAPVSILTSERIAQSCCGNRINFSRKIYLSSNCQWCPSKIKDSVQVKSSNFSIMTIIAIP